MPKTISYKVESIIFFSGDKGEDIYIVQSGVVVTKSIDIETGKENVETLKTGEFFGVKSAFAKTPRMVTAVAATDAVVISLTIAEFERLFSPNKNITEKMLRIFSKSLREIHKQTVAVLHNDVVTFPQDVGMLMVAKAFYDDEEFHSCVEIINKLLSEIPEPSNKEAAEKLLADAKQKAEAAEKNVQVAVSAPEVKEDNSLKQFSAPIFQRFTKEFKRGDVIICEDEPGETFYLVKSGEVQIVKCITGQNKNLDIIHTGEFFGEMAIIDKSQRSATCVAKTDVSVLEFNKENFATLVLGNPHLVMNLLKLFCKRICDQSRRLKIILIKDLSVRLCDVFLMYDALFTTKQDIEIMNQRRTFNVTVNDLAHWAAISVESARDELNKLVEKNKIEVFDNYINVINIHDMKRTVDSYYNNLNNDVIQKNKKDSSDS